MAVVSTVAAKGIVYFPGIARCDVLNYMLDFADLAKIQLEVSLSVHQCISQEM